MSHKFSFNVENIFVKITRHPEVLGCLRLLPQSYQIKFKIFMQHLILNLVEE